MPLLTAQSIPHPYPREFVPAHVHLGDWGVVESLLKNLQTRFIGSKMELEKWIGDLNELEQALSEEGSIRYVRMTCKTDDPQIEKDYLDFLENIGEPSKPLFFNLMKKYWESPYRLELNPKDYFLYNRSVENQLALYREKNIPLETELEKLSQQYQKLSGSLTVRYDGQEQTLQQMGRYLESTDRKKREEAWKLTAECRLREKDKFDDLFDAMLKIRVQIAKNAGFDNYRDYMFRRKERFDYTVEDCETFHESAEKVIQPLVHQMQKRRMEKMGLTSLQPWDLLVDPTGLEPLKPFKNVDELIGGCEAILGQIDPEFGQNFKTMKDLGLLDLESRKGKAPGGYQTDLEEARIPFIFANAVGMDHDVRTLLHESGHAMHSFAWKKVPFYPYRHAPMEFCEVASMSMELMADPYLSAFYRQPPDAARSIIKHLEDVISLLPWIATIDAFQHWIYTHPDHTRQERSDYWVALRKRLGGIEDWTGFEEVRASLWHRQLHIFEVPFYYIEYGIAQLGALQVWKNFRQDKAEGVRLYKQGLSVGGSQTLPEIFESAGIHFDFSLKMIEPLMREVAKELQNQEAVS